MESCEIHSMSMEFLTAEHHEKFFGTDTPRYELAHAEDAMYFLPYGTMVDEFQHIMYAEPDLTPGERNAVWAKLESEYRPWLDFAGLPFYGRGAGWQRQLHIYEVPFYYIDSVSYTHLDVYNRQPAGRPGASGVWYTAAPVSSST